MIRTGLPARIDDWTVLPGPVVARHVAAGFGQCVAAPLIIEGTIWGLISAFGEANQVLPPGSEARLADFTQLMASAIANAQVRDELHGLAERQGAALRRVATLVAGQAPSQVIFNAVAAEASRALGVARVDVGRHDAHGTVTLLGSTGRQAPDPAPWGGHRVAAAVLETGRAARVECPPDAEETKSDDEADTGRPSRPPSVPRSWWTARPGASSSCCRTSRCPPTRRPASPTLPTWSLVRSPTSTRATA